MKIETSQGIFFCRNCPQKPFTFKYDFVVTPNRDMEYWFLRAL